MLISTFEMWFMFFTQRFMIMLCNLTMHMKASKYLIVLLHFSMCSWVFCFLTKCTYFTLETEKKGNELTIERLAHIIQEIEMA